MAFAMNERRRAPNADRQTMSDTPDPFATEHFPADDSAGVSDAELRTLLAQAKAGGDEPLRRLLASYITLRTLTAEMLTLLGAREGGIGVARTPLFSRLRHLTRRTKT